MARANSWRDLWVGVVALTLLVLAGGAVLRFARVGALHGDAVPLYAATPHARGVLPGSEVWLEGQKVGVVRAVGFRPANPDTSAPVLLTLDVLTEVLPLISRDAQPDIRAGGSFVGSPVVWFSIAASGAPTVRAGDTLVSRRSRELDAVRLELAGAAAEVPLILDNLRVLAAQLHSARSTLGALGVEGVTEIGATAGQAKALLGTVTTGRGTVGLMLRRGEPMARARRAMAQADSVRALLAGSRGSLGRLQRDSTLLRTMEAISRDLARAQAALIEPRGAAGRLQHDSALVQQVARTRVEMDALAADLRRNPLRYLPF
jgi:ABC-type transporter Mla subunit MlaD